MKRLTVALLVSTLVLTVGAAPASAGIRIKRISFDPAGADTGTSSHLNKEWVLLKNTGQTDVQMRGWKLFDLGRDHVYRFYSLFLSPGDSVRLRTGRGSDGAPVCEVGEPCGAPVFNMHWGLDNYVWNNDGDRVTLVRSNGNIADRCRYGASADSPKRC